MPNTWGFGSVTMGSAVINTTTAGTVLAANANRKYLRLENISDIQVWLGFGAAAVTNQGASLPGLGTVGRIHEMSPGLGNLYTGVIRGTVAAGQGTIVYIEGEDA